MLKQILFHLHRVRTRNVDLVDRDDHRHARVLGMGDRLDCLRHYLVVRSDDEHDDVRDLRAAGAHGRERFVARRVEERDRLAGRQIDVIRTDVLRNSSRLTGHDVRLADVVEQRCLAVVYVTHDRDDRWTRLQLLRRILGGWRGLEIRRVLFFLHCLESEFAGDQFDLVEIEPLVDRDHQAEVLECEPDDLDSGDLEDLRELVDRDELVDANGLLLTASTSAACCAASSSR